MSVWAAVPGCQGRLREDPCRPTAAQSEQHSSVCWRGSCWAGRRWWSASPGPVLLSAAVRLPLAPLSHPPHCHIISYLHQTNQQSLLIGGTVEFSRCRFARKRSPGTVGGASLDECRRRFVVDGRQTGDVADQFVEERRLDQIRLFRYQRLLSQHNLHSRTNNTRHQSSLNYMQELSSHEYYNTALPKRDVLIHS